MTEKVSDVDVRNLKTPTVKSAAVKVDLKRNIREKIEENIAVEVPFNIFVNDEHITTVLVTPHKLKEFTVGFLIDEGILKGKDEIADLWIGDTDIKVKTAREQKMRVEAYRIARVITTACGSAEEFLRLLDRVEKPSVKSELKVPLQTVSAAAATLSRMASTFGMHGAAVFNGDGKLVSLSEDVGRHNAIDKAVGEAVLADVDLTGCFLVSTGRQSADMVLKAVRVGIPLVVSLAGPIFSGIYVSEKTGLTLIGGARGAYLRIYTHPERII